MLPTTVVGIVLFLVFLLPGFTFALSRERHRPVRRLSAFRETAWTVLASSVAFLIAVGLFLVCALIWAPVSSLGRAALSNPEAYFAEHPLWSIGVVGGYIAVAGVLSWIAGSPAPRIIWRKIRKSDVIDPAASSWWVLFEQHPTLEKLVGVTLTDGTWIGGTLRSWSRDAEESADRDLTIQAPIFIRNPGSKKTQPVADAGAMAISARNVLYLTVEYSAND